MKKYSLLLLLLTLVLLAACGAAEQPAGLPNPMSESDAGSLAAEGLFLPAPEGAAEAAYFRYDMGKEPPLGELRFTLDGKEAALRAQRTDLTELTISDEQMAAVISGESDLTADQPWDISGLYFNWEGMGTALVKEEPALWCAGEGAGLVAWVDAGVLYNLTMSKGADQESLLSLAEQVFVSTTDK